MKSGMMGGLALAALAVAGCNKDKVAEATAADKDAVVLEVNGAALTRGELDADLDKFIAAQKVPAEQVEEARKAIGEQMAQAFLMKTLLLGEADRLGVTVTDDERKKREEEFVKASAGRPGAPKSIDEFAEKYPLGKARGLQEFADSIRIQKLLDQEVTGKVKADAKLLEERFAAAMSNYTAAVKAAAGAETKIKDLKKQLDGLTGDALTNKFAQLAREHSDCPSKSKGGDLGLFTRGQMVPEFDKVSFEIEPLTVSEPVKTQFGWHLVLVTRKVAAVEAKGDTPAEPEKVQASHILVTARVPEKAPTKEQIEKGLKRQEEQTALQTYFENLRKNAKISAPGFPSLQPKETAAPKADEAKKPDAPAEAAK